MNLFTLSFSALRTWLGLGDPSDGRLTPSHGWLLPPARVPVPRPVEGISPPDPRLR